MERGPYFVIEEFRIKEIKEKIPVFSLVSRVT